MSIARGDDVTVYLCSHNYERNVPVRCKLKWLSTLPIALLAITLSAPAMAEQVAFFNFNDNSMDDVAIDSSGKGNDGILVGAEYTGPGGGVTGEPGDLALNLGDFNDGSFLDLNDRALDGAFDSLVEEDKATIAFYLFGNDEQPQNQWTFWFGPGRQLGSHAPWGNGTVYFDVAGCCAANQRIQKNIPDRSLYAEQWNHYAFVKDEGYTAIYLNGDLFHDSGDDLKDPLFEITEAAFGADSTGGGSHGGLMDDIGVWDEALSADAIKGMVDLPPTFVAGKGTIGVRTFSGDQTNPEFGPEQPNVPGFSAALAADTGETIDNHTIAEDVLDQFIEDGDAILGAYNEVDLAGGGGTFGENHPYPNGVNDASMDDFAVRVTADLVIPVGEWTIGLGSDDGGKIQIEGVEFLDSQNNDNFEDNEIRFEGNRGHGWTVGTFEVTGEPLETTLVGSFHERGGGDSFEIAVLDEAIVEDASPDTGWELLADGTFGWKVTTTTRPLVSADLVASVSTTRPLEFDVNGDTNEQDQLTIDNPDPNIFTTILDVDGATFQINGTGAFADGERFDIIDTDQVTGTPIIVAVVDGQTWAYDPATGNVCFNTCGGGVLTGDYNMDGALDVIDIDLQSAEMKKDVADQDLAKFDHNGDGMVDEGDRTIWVKNLRETWVGDSNFDNEFNSGDLVQVFAAGKYETEQMAGWADGDWNGDMVFDSSDLVAAFSDGGYEMGPPPAAVAAVPEPSSLVLALLSVMGLVGIVRRRNG